MNQVVADYIYNSCPKLNRKLQLQKVNRNNTVYYRRTKNSKITQVYKVLLELNDTKQINSSTRKVINDMLIDDHQDNFGLELIDKRLFQLHHNIPKSVKGKNNISNLYCVTANEHEQLHIMLGGKQITSLPRKTRIRLNNENKLHMQNLYSKIFAKLSEIENKIKEVA